MDIISVKAWRRISASFLSSVCKLLQSEQSRSSNWKKARSAGLPLSEGQNAQPQLPAASGTELNF